jgi:hypothetical protein
MTCINHARLTQITSRRPFALRRLGEPVEQLAQDIIGRSKVPTAAASSPLVRRSNTDDGIPGDQSSGSGNSKTFSQVIMPGGHGIGEAIEHRRSTNDLGGAVGAVSVDRDAAV